MSRKKNEYIFGKELPSLVQSLMSEISLYGNSLDEIKSLRSAYEGKFLNQFEKESAYHTWKYTEDDRKEKIKLGKHIIKKLTEGIIMDRASEAPSIGLVNYLALKITELAENKENAQPVMDFLVMATVRASKRDVSDRATNYLAEAIAENKSVTAYYKQIKLKYKPNVAKKAVKSVKKKVKAASDKIKSRSDSEVSESEFGTKEDSASSSARGTDTESGEVLSAISSESESLEAFAENERLSVSHNQSSVIRDIDDAVDKLDVVSSHLIDESVLLTPDLETAIDASNLAVQTVEEALDVMDVHESNQDLLDDLEAIAAALNQTMQIAQDIAALDPTTKKQADIAPKEDVRDVSHTESVLQDEEDYGKNRPPKDKEEMYSSQQFSDKYESLHDDSDSDLDEFGHFKETHSLDVTGNEMEEVPADPVQRGVLSELLTKLANVVNSIASWFKQIKKTVQDKLEQRQYKAYQATFSGESADKGAESAALNHYVQNDLSTIYDIEPFITGDLATYEEKVTIPLELMLQAVSDGTHFDVQKLQDDHVSLMEKRAIVDRLGAMLSKHLLNESGEMGIDNALKWLIKQADRSIEYESEYQGILVCALRHTLDSDQLAEHQDITSNALLNRKDGEFTSPTLLYELEELKEQGYITTPWQSNELSRARSLDNIVKKLLKGDSTLSHHFEVAMAKKNAPARKHAIAKVLGIRNHTKWMRISLASANSEQRESIALSAELMKARIDDCVKMLDAQPFDAQTSLNITSIQAALTNESQKLDRLICDANNNDLKTKVRRFTHGARAAVKSKKGQTATKLSELPSSFVRQFKKEHAQQDESDLDQKSDRNPSKKS